MTPNTAYNMSFAVHGFFHRADPPAHKKAHFHDVKTLNPNNYADCLTRQQLLEFSNFNCCKQKNGLRELYAPSNKAMTIRFSQAYNPNKLLGATSEAGSIWRFGGKGQHIPQPVPDDYGNNQKRDISVRFQCPDQWSVFASENVTEIANTTLHAAKVVNPETCETAYANATRVLSQQKGSNETELAKELKNLHLDLNATQRAELERISDDGDVTWVRVGFTLFSLLASSGFFAGWSVTTFYVGVVLVLGGTVRVSLINNFWKGWQYETTFPDTIIKLCEAVVLHRQEVNNIGEEECYRML